MREIVGSSVVLTVSESMLNARALIKPETRASTPKWFSTRQEMVCFSFMLCCAYVPTFVRADVRTYARPHVRTSVNLNLVSLPHPAPRGGAGACHLLS